MDFEWFDKKYQNGKTPTLEDKAALFSQLDIRLPDRARDKIINELKQTLHELGRQYKPSTHMLAHNLLFCFAPILGIDPAEYSEYMRLYNHAMQKHRGKTAFRDNFPPSET